MGPGGQSDDRGVPAYAGWVFHVGTSSLGYQFCRPRFLVIRSKYVTMFKSDPNEIPGLGLVGSHLMVEEVGRREIHNKALYVLKIYSRLDDSRQGEFACDTPEEVEKWISAFRHAKEEAEISSSRLGSGYRILDSDDEFDINGPRKDSRAMSRGIGKLITIGKGPEALLRRPSIVTKDFDIDGLYNHREGDTFETTDWKCFYTVNSLRIFEDVASKAEKGTIMKSVGVVDGAPETIFEFIMSLEKSLRSQWDIMIGDLQLVEQIDGHTDIVYGSFDPKYFKRFQKKSDFLFSRYWRRDQDGSYSITQISTTHKKWPPKSGFNRMNISPGIWEITPLPPKPVIGTPRCLVTQIIEVKSTGWGRWKRSSYSKFHTSIPYILLCRTAGLRELVAANPEHVELESQVETKEVKKLMEEPGLGGITSLLTQPSNSFMDTQEEFYDALMIEDPEEEEEEKAAQGKFAKRAASQKFKGISYGIMLGLSKSKKIPETKAEQELDWHAPTVFLDEDIFQSGLRKCVGPNDTNGWSDPGAKNFMVRGRTYNDDGLKIPGGDPLLKLLAVDWLKSERRIDHIAKQSNCCVQSDAGKKAPFILVINLQVPAKPNYSLVSYFVADRPIRCGSLLDRFANGDNAFRNARFKLIPSIVEGYWVVKRAVGTKACLLGRAVTCNYLREDNFLEIDVDIGSSSVARNVVGLVLGYITSIVVDLAVLIEATNADELPEYALGTVSIDRMKLESAIEI